jgi:hypothetical protein
MNKIIIDNRSDLEEACVLSLVAVVMSKGRISNSGKQYCYLTVLTIHNKQYQVATELNKCSDRFIINKHDL